MNSINQDPQTHEWVLITGAARRLGRALALGLAGQGINLILHYNRSGDQARELANEIAALGVDHLLIQSDLSEAEGQEKLISEAGRTSGNLTGLVNNASVYVKTPLEPLERSLWDQTLATNLTAPVFLAARLGMEMKKNSGGSIVQIGDWSTSRPYLNYLAYSVSKGGLETATRALARELAPSVRVNLLALGPILLPDDSDASYADRVKRAVPLGKIGGAASYVEAVMFLLGNASYCTGSILTMDGGRDLA